MERLKFSTSVELVRVPTEDIAFIKAAGNYSDIYLSNGKKMTLTSQLHCFEEAIEKLKVNFFVRVGKSLIVNKNFIYSINISLQEILLMDNRLASDFKLKASKDALKELKNILEQEGDNL